MSTGPSVDKGFRTMLLHAAPGRARQTAARAGGPPVVLAAPRHLSLLACLIFDGPLAVNELAARR